MFGSAEQDDESGVVWSRSRNVSQLFTSGGSGGLVVFEELWLGVKNNFN